MPSLTGLLWNRTGLLNNDVALFGLKEHVSVDVRQGFVLATEITPASHHDSPYLPLFVLPEVVIPLKRYSQISIMFAFFKGLST